MVDKEEDYVRDLYKKLKGKELYHGIYRVGNKTYQEDGEVVNKSIALDEEALGMLKARIETMFIDEIKPKGAFLVVIK